MPACLICAQWAPLQVHADCLNPYENEKEGNDDSEA